MADNGTLYKTQEQKKKAIEELQKKAIQLKQNAKAETLKNIKTIPI